MPVTPARPRRRPAGMPFLALAGVGAGMFLLARSTRPAPAASRGFRAPHRVVIVGAGFGGLAAAQSLARVPGVHVTLIDEHNHHLFQPLLYQVATGMLNPDDIASPVRGIVAGEHRVTPLMATVSGIDLDRREVRCDGHTLPYDTLVLATGSQVSYFGHESWRESALGLKTLDDALLLRRRILTNLEQAAKATSPAERDRHLTFVLVGGGTTGVEMAGAIAELAREVLAQEFQDQPELRAKVILLEAGPTLLAGFAADLAASATRDLRRMGVDVRTGTKVEGIQPDRVSLGQEQIMASTIVWTAGVAATPVAEWLELKPAKGGRVEVAADLHVPSRPGVYVIGDAALALDRHGKPLPGVAAVAKQQGAYVARAVRRAMRRSPPAAPFHYRDYGTMATIGRNSAVAEIGGVHLKGFVGWLTWAVAHIFFLIGFRNRVMVSAQWAFAYLTHERGNRLLIGRRSPVLSQPEQGTEKGRTRSSRRDPLPAPP